MNCYERKVFGEKKNDEVFQITQENGFSFIDNPREKENIEKEIAFMQNFIIGLYLANIYDIEVGKRFWHLGKFMDQKEEIIINSIINNIINNTIKIYKYAVNNILTWKISTPDYDSSIYINIHYHEDADIIKAYITFVCFNEYTYNTAICLKFMVSSDDVECIYENKLFPITISSNKTDNTLQYFISNKHMLRVYIILMKSLNSFKTKRNQYEKTRISHDSSEMKIIKKILNIKNTKNAKLININRILESDTTNHDEFYPLIEYDRVNKEKIPSISFNSDEWELLRKNVNDKGLYQDLSNGINLKEILNNQQHKLVFNLVLLDDKEDSYSLDIYPIIKNEYISIILVYEINYGYMGRMFISVIIEKPEEFHYNDIAEIRIDVLLSNVDNIPKSIRDIKWKIPSVFDKKENIMEILDFILITYISIYDLPENFRIVKITPENEVHSVDKVERFLMTEERAKKFIKDKIKNGAEEYSYTVESWHKEAHWSRSKNNKEYWVKDHICFRNEKLLKKKEEDIVVEL